MNIQYRIFFLAITFFLFISSLAIANHYKYFAAAETIFRLLVKSLTCKNVICTDIKIYVHRFSCEPPFINLVQYHTE